MAVQHWRAGRGAAAALFRKKGHRSPPSLNGGASGNAFSRLPAPQWGGARPQCARLEGRPLHGTKPRAFRGFSAPPLGAACPLANVAAAHIIRGVAWQDEPAGTRAAVGGSAPAMSRGQSPLRNPTPRGLFGVMASVGGSAKLPTSSTEWAVPSPHSIATAAAAGNVAQGAGGKQLLALLYTYVEGILEKRAPHRAGHLALCQSLQDRGSLLLGGPLGDPPTHGLLVLLASGPEEVEAELVAKDPYVANGLVTEHKIMPWNVVVGSLAGSLGSS